MKLLKFTSIAFACILSYSPLSMAETAAAANIATFDLYEEQGAEVFNENVRNNGGQLAFMVDEVEFNFTTTITNEYGLVHLYGTNVDGDFLRMIKADDDTWFGDVSNGTKAFSFVNVPTMNGPIWLKSAYLHPRNGDLLVDGAVPIKASKLTSTNLDVGYVFSLALATTYGRKGARASSLYYHYQLQDILDNSGSGYYLNPLFIEQQDERFIPEGETIRPSLLFRGWEFMFGEQVGAKEMRSYFKAFGVDYITNSLATTPGLLGCGVIRNEKEKDDIGQAAFVKDEEQRTEIIFGSVIDGRKSSCNNAATARMFFSHVFAARTRAFYENQIFLPENKRTDYGGFSDYAYASKCGDYPTVMNFNTRDTVTIPVISSPNITFKGETCGDADNDNLTAMMLMLPEVANNANLPVITADARFKTATYIGLEGSQAKVTLVRTGDTTESASVEVGIRSANNPSSAVEGTDFIAEFKRVMFAAGNSEATFSVNIKDNDRYLDNGTIELALYLPNKLTVTDSKAKLIIIDNDSANPGDFNFAASEVFTNEAAGSVAIKIIRTGGEGSQMIRYSFLEGTAKSGSDFISSPGQLVFADGETEKTITVELPNDSYANLFEKRFQVQIDTVIAGEIQLVDVIIGDDEYASGTIEFSVDVNDVDYHSSGATITLTRSDATSGVISVHYMTDDGTAVNGTDYVGVNNSIVFAAGEAEKKVFIKRMDTKDVADDLNFTVTFSSSHLETAKVITVNLLAEVERVETKSGGSLGIYSFILFMVVGLRRRFN